MKFLCEQSDLAEALNIVSKAISPNNTLPVLNNILVKLEEKKAVMIATNLEIAIKVSIPAEIKSEGGITIPAKLVTSYINLLENQKLEINEASGETITIKSKSSQSKIKGISPDEFPIIPKIEKLGKFSIDAKILLGMINKTAFAASNNLARPVLSGVFFDLQADVFKMVATDSYRLSETKFELIDKIKDPLSCIIPARTILELGKILMKAEDENVDITFAKNQVMFNVGNIELTSRLIEGSFPDYEKIIPSEIKSNIKLKREDFILAVKKVNLFVPDNNCAKIDVDEKKMVLHTDETQVGEGTVDLEGELTGESNNIALNSQYLLDILQVLDEDDVSFEMNDKLSPVIVKAIDKKDFIHIIMPLKV
ncbi:DNA polymerase III subunit beta [Patescibacteria group bacterium]|nr:DNA polymerase III subunit beta [Patescibacteria group bacterium]